jgi:hypothetical protein
MPNAQDQPSSQANPQEKRHMKQTPKPRTFGEKMADRHDAITNSILRKVGTGKHAFTVPAKTKKPKRFSPQKKSRK